MNTIEKPEHSLSSSTQEFLTARIRASPIFEVSWTHLGDHECFMKDNISFLQSFSELREILLNGAAILLPAVKPVFYQHLQDQRPHFQAHFSSQRFHPPYMLSSWVTKFEDREASFFNGDGQNCALSYAVTSAYVSIGRSLCSIVSIVGHNRQSVNNYKKFYNTNVRDIGTDNTMRQKIQGW